MEQSGQQRTNGNETAGIWPARAKKLHRVYLSVGTGGAPGRYFIRPTYRHVLM